MYRTLISLASAAAVGAMFGAAFYTAPAQAQASITIINSTCTGFTQSGSATAMVLTCNGSTGGGGGGVTPPSGCSLSPTSQTLASGAPATISASCTGGVFPITHTLASNGVFNGRSAQQPNASTPAVFQLPVTAAETVSGYATSSGGSATTPHSNTSAVTISGGGGGGGGGSGGSLANCSAQGYAVIGGNAITMPWGGGTFLSGGFDEKTAWVFSFTPPQGTPSTTNWGNMAISEYGTAPVARQISISTTPCDFRWPSDSRGVTGPLYAASGSSAFISYFGVGTSYPFNLVAGTTYYISIRNYDLYSNTPQCVGASCGARFSVNGAN